jgi:ABC-type sugar transport system permease subunit
MSRGKLYPGSFFWEKQYMLKRKQLDNIHGWLFIAPPILIFTVFIFIPMGIAFFVSLQKWNLLSPMRFVGFANYSKMFTSDHFWNSVMVSLLYVAGTVPVSIGLGLGIAILLNQGVRGVSFYRIMIYLPVITSMAAAAIVFRYIFEPNIGFFNYTLSLVGLPPMQWLNDRHQALIAVIIVGIWKRVGYNAIIMLAGLQAIPRFYYEAATIDGASKFQMVRKITIPLLAPVTFFVTVMQIIASFKVFTSIVVMTEGGPARGTDVLPYFLYKNAFQYHKMGYASAAAIFLFTIIFIFTLFQFKFGEKKVHYQ